MTSDKAIDVLATCFMALPDDMLGNLAYHERCKTRICCGTQSLLYTDGEGGG